MKPASDHPAVHAPDSLRGLVRQPIDLPLGYTAALIVTIVTASIPWQPVRGLIAIANIGIIVYTWLAGRHRRCVVCGSRRCDSSYYERPDTWE